MRGEEEIRRALKFWSSQSDCWKKNADRETARLMRDALRWVLGENVKVAATKAKKLI